MYIRFDWNLSKAKSNIRKQGVSFEQAASVFFDEFAMQLNDDVHSVGEERFIMPGMSERSRLLIVCHREMRATGAIRIISARQAAAREHLFYRSPGQ